MERSDVISSRVSSGSKKNRKVSFLLAMLCHMPSNHILRIVLVHILYCGPHKTQHQLHTKHSLESFSASCRRPHRSHIVVRCVGKSEIIVFENMRNERQLNSFFMLALALALCEFISTYRLRTFAMRSHCSRLLKVAASCAYTRTRLGPRNRSIYLVMCISLVFYLERDVYSASRTAAA